MEAQTARPAGRLFRFFPLPLGLAIFLIQISIGIILFSVFQEFVPNQMGTTDAWPGYMLASYGAARFIFETPTGAISDRVERKLALLIGFVLMLPAVILMGLVREKTAYLAFAALLGCGTAFIWPAAYAISADLYPSSMRGKVAGFLNVNQFLGFGMGALIGALLVERMPTALFIFASVAVVTAFVATQVGIPKYRSSGLFGPRQHENRPRLWSIMSGRLICVAGFVLGSSTALAMLVPIIRPYGEDELGLSFARLTLYMGPAILLAAALYIPAGHISDRIGRMRPVIVGQLLLMAGALAASFTSEVAGAAFASILVVCGNVLSVPAMNAAVMDLAPASHRGALIGLTVALSGLGLAIGPAVSGFVLGAEGPAIAFRVAAGTAGLTALAVAIYYWRVELRKPSPHPA